MSREYEFNYKCDDCEEEFATLNDLGKHPGCPSCVIGHTNRLDNPGK
jgi:DNA-directed RNA polymerase subunit RPC12/RpoP